MPKSPFIDKQTAVEAYTESKDWYRRYTDPLDEFERIARNKPSENLPKQLPRITDGTTAGIIQEGPKRIVQQTPTGLIECDQYPEYAKMADIVNRMELMPYYNHGGNFLQKSWLMLNKAGTWGSAASYTYFTETNGIMHMDFKIPYRKDVLGEKGKAFAPDSNVQFIRSWYQKSDLKAILNREKKAKQSDWDLVELAKFIDAGASHKPGDLQTAAEREKGGDVGGYEIIHAFQTGKGAEMYSFAPRHNQGKPLRTKVNKDPRGAIPIDYLYCNMDGSNPVGRGQVEMSGGVQNLIDQQMQMYQFLSTLMMAPPIIAYGNVNKNTLKMAPWSVWDGGVNPQTSRIDTFKVDNTQIVNFPTNYGLLKSQVLQLNNSSQSATVSSEAGNPAFSKTQAGVEAQQSQLGVSDNYLRKQYEDWFADQQETAVNNWFAEKTGSTKLKLSREDMRDIMKTEAAQFVNEQGELQVPYSKINDVSFKFQTNASSSEIKENSENVEKLIQTLELIIKVPDPTVQQKVPGLIKVIAKEIGAEGIDEIFPEEELGPDGMPMQGQQQQQGMDPQAIQQLVMQTVQEAMAQKQEQDKEPAELQLIKALGVKFDKLPEQTRNVILEQLGLPSEGDDPIAFDQTVNAFNTLGQAESQMNQAEQAQQQMTMQANQPQSGESGGQTSQSENNGGEPDIEALTPEEEPFVEELINRGFEENDIEQAVIMRRSGLDENDIMQVLMNKQGVPA